MQRLEEARQEAARKVQETETRLATLDHGDWQWMDAFDYLENLKLLQAGLESPDPVFGVACLRRFAELESVRLGEKIRNLELAELKGKEHSPSPSPGAC